MERNTEICSRIENELPLFVGGELDANTRGAVRAHLELCDECRTRESAARRAHVALARGLGLTGSAHSGSAHSGSAHSGSVSVPSLWSGVRAGLERDGVLRAPAAPAPLLSGPGSTWRTRRSTWWTAAAAALVLCTAWFVRQQLAAQDEPSPNLVDVPAGRGARPEAEPLETVPVGLTPNAFEGVAAVTPASGLRRLSPHERPLSDSAEPLPSEQRSLLLIPTTNAIPSLNSNSAATLRRVQPWQ